MALIYATEDEYKAYLNAVYTSLYADRDTGDVIDAWFTADCEGAEAFTKPYLTAKYIVADLDADSKIFMREIVRKILMNLAYAREGYANIPDGVTDAYSQAIAQLLDIKDSKIILTATTVGGEDPVIDTGIFKYGSCENVYDCDGI